jgi:hypothetical protein
LAKISLKNILRALAKIGLSGLALYVVFKKIDIQETKTIFLGADVLWLIPGLLAFNISKIISSIRLNTFFASIDLSLKWFYNLKLYYVGMFYNLFLPGGIGGDGYKVYVLNKYYKTPLKPLITASLLDRISGMVSLGFLAFVLALTLKFPITGIWPQVTLWLFVSGTFPVYYFIHRIFFNRFKSVFIQGNIYSLFVQGFQLISAYCILRALGVNNLFPEYQVLFLVSSVVAVLPFTIGGVGARELVFILGSNYFYINRNTAIAFSMMFFLITAVSSFPGIFPQTKPQTTD